MWGLRYGKTKKIRPSFTLSDGKSYRVSHKGNEPELKITKSRAWLGFLGNGKTVGALNYGEMQPLVLEAKIQDSFRKVLEEDVRRRTEKKHLSKPRIRKRQTYNIDGSTACQKELQYDVEIRLKIFETITFSKACTKTQNTREPESGYNTSDGCESSTDVESLDSGVHGMTELDNLPSATVSLSDFLKLPETKRLRNCKVEQDEKTLKISGSLDNKKTEYIFLLSNKSKPMLVPASLIADGSEHKQTKTYLLEPEIVDKLKKTKEDGPVDISLSWEGSDSQIMNTIWHNGKTYSGIYDDQGELTTVTEHNQLDLITYTKDDAGCFVETKREPDLRRPVVVHPPLTSCGSLDGCAWV